VTRVGRLRLLLIGAAAFGVVSVAAAYAGSAEQLIAARALLGVAGATIAPSTLSLIFAMFADPRERATAVAVWISAFSAGSAVGPVLGGVLLEHFWWGSVFLLALPVTAAMLVLGPVVLPEYRDVDAGRLDLASVGLSLAAVLAVIFGCKQIAQDGLGGAALATIASGVAVGVVFARRQLTLDDPMIDLRLFRNRRFSTALAVNLLGIFVAVGYFLYVAQYLQLVIGLSPLQAGLWSVPSAVGFIVGSQAAPHIVARVDAGRVIVVGLAIAAVGLGVLTRVDGGSADLTVLVAASVIVSLGLAPVLTVTTDLIVGSAPPERAGAASGISETAAELGGALGLSILDSIGVAVYRADLATLPAVVPAQAAAAIRDTLGAAVAVAGRLPHGLQAQVLAAARDAFIDGVRVTAAIAVAIAAVAAVTFRRPHTTPTVDVHVPPTPATETDSPSSEQEASRCAP
jgi:DHA2 family multidrug resistance protein-like MFS transporter